MAKARLLFLDQSSKITRLESVLQRQGYDVFSIIPNGNLDAVLEEKQPDLVFVNVDRPGAQTSLEIARSVQSKMGVAVVLLADSAKSAEAASQEDDFSCLVNPFSNQELSLEVKQALHLQRMEQRMNECETRMHAVFNGVRDCLFVVDRSGRCVDVNQAVCTLSGFSREEILANGRLLNGLLEVEGQPRQGAGQEDTRPLRFRLSRKDGEHVLVERVCQPVGLGGSGLMLEVLHDISARARTEIALARASASVRESDERFQLAANGIHDGMWDWNLKSGKVFFSRRFQAILGCDENSIGDSPDGWFDLVHKDDLVRLQADLAEHLNERHEVFQNEHRIRHVDGTYRWVLARGIAARDVNGIAYRIAGSLTDMTAYKRVEEQLLHDALHDSLTGLPNRMLFIDRLSHALQRSHRRKESGTFAVLYLDVDRFKVVNDSLGHSTGDALLISVAQLLKGCLRDVDTIARLGGDEFVILLEGIENPDGARLVSERIEELFRRQPVMLGGSRVVISASIGMVMADSEYKQPEEILRDADIAMYQAKRMGKARTVLFQPEMRKYAVARMELETDLRLAIEREEFELLYQPIISFTTGETAGFEALLRWRHPRYGLLAPSQFLTIAEETGMILEIGTWVLRKATLQLVEWKRYYPSTGELTVSVNISSQQISQPGFASLVDGILAQSGLDPHFLRLEVVENILLEKADSTLDTIHALRSRGIQLDIDDFGTGYSALSYIQNFPIDTIKIDRSFIEGVGNPESNQEFIRSILSLANSLGLDTVAEGIETKEQMHLLKEMLCPFGQGYFISRPLSTSVIEERLTNGEELHTWEN